MSFSQIIISWYRKNKRDLPWRKTCDPYHIWVSEIILQQTRVQQGLNYYYDFIRNYPTIEHLANAPLQNVLKVWQGLGYYSRARNMHETAEIIMDKYGGRFPDEYSNIKSLKGVGEYTAAAIASIAFKKAYPVIDGNVYRVLSRYYAIDLSIDNSQGKKYFRKIAESLLDKNNPGDFNQAMMELGATVCQTSHPKCPECPLSNECQAFQKNQVSHFPIRNKKKIQKKRHFNYVIILSNNYLCIQKREGLDIWNSLYEFPLIESNQLLDEKQLLADNEWDNGVIEKENTNILYESKAYRHMLTHQIIYAKFFIIKIEPDKLLHFIQQQPKMFKIHGSELKHYPIPKLIENFLKEINVKDYCF